MAAAHRDALAGLPSRYDPDDTTGEQPRVYANTEFKVIDFLG